MGSGTAAGGTAEGGCWKDGRQSEIKMRGTAVWGKSKTGVRAGVGEWRQRALAIDNGDTEIIKDRQRKDPEMCRSEPGPSWYGREGPRRVDGSNQDGEGGPMPWALRRQISGQSSDTGHPAATSQAQ